MKLLQSDKAKQYRVIAYLIQNSNRKVIKTTRTRKRRNRIYRRLFTENVVYKEDTEDQDYNYIRNYGGAINQDVDKILESNLEVHKNGAYILLTQDKNFKNTFPSNKGICYYANVF